MVGDVFPLPWSSLFDAPPQAMLNEGEEMSCYFAKSKAKEKEKEKDKEDIKTPLLSNIPSSSALAAAGARAGAGAAAGAAPSHTAISIDGEGSKRPLLGRVAEGNEWDEEAAGVPWPSDLVPKWVCAHA